MVSPLKVNGEFDRAVTQWLLGNGVPLLTGFQLGLLDGVRLKEGIKPGGFAPSAAVVIVFQLTSIELADDGVVPARKLHGQATYAAGKQLRSALHRLRQAQPVAGGSDSSGVPDLGFDFNDVTDDRAPFRWM